MSPLQSVQHNTTLAVDDEGWVDHVDDVQKTADPLCSRLRSLPSAPRSMAFVHPIAQIASSRPRWYDVLRPASLRRNRGRSQHVRVARTSLQKMIFRGPPSVLQDSSRVILPAKKHCRSPTATPKQEPPHKTTRAKFPKTGRRVDNL